VKACGVIVEYNPFHYGHKYHIEKAKKISNADCMIAVMSGSFLQRGEPAIVDKFHRAKAALSSGIDILLELPYHYSVQSSDLFAKGTVSTLNEIGVKSICFGSESGSIKSFIEGYQLLKNEQHQFDHYVQYFLTKGNSFPAANQKAFEAIGLKHIDMVQPNNILGFSYVKQILNNQYPIEPQTIKRIKNDFHEKVITNKIASATSIRKELTEADWTKSVTDALPTPSIEQLKNYYEHTETWHHWEAYFSLLRYRILSMSLSQLALIQGVDEGLEHRVKKTIINAKNFQDWMNSLKSKRYTEVRLQRMATHILTNTTKKESNAFTRLSTVPYLRLLGMTETGQTYLNQIKKRLETPLISNLSAKYASLINTDEKALQVYYSILAPENQIQLRKQEFQLPILN